MLLRDLSILSLCLLWLSVTSIHCARGQEAAANKSDSVSTTAKSVEIPLQNGTVESNLIFEQVADELHWIAGSVAGFTKALGVEGSSPRLEKEQIDDLIARFPSLFHYRNDAEGNPVALVIEREQLAENLTDRKSQLRQWLAAVDHTEISSLTKVDATWKGQPDEPPRIVIAAAGLHGFESSSEAVALKLFDQTHLPMCVFAYPNDAPIKESAQRLVEHLEQLHREYPKSKMTLVTHSMGGLVARGALELTIDSATGTRNPFASRYGVDQLIQVCPPNHGSAVAEYGPLLEGGEQLVRLVDRRGTKKSRALFSAITDGFNEASTDLIPGSEILEQLNAQQRNPNVEYTILAGNDGPLRAGMTLLLGAAWDRLAGAINEPKLLDERIRDLLRCDDMQKGKGDGVVALSSARLEGVEDFQVMPMHHLAWSQLDSDEGQDLIREISKRLESAH